MVLPIYAYGQPVLKKVAKEIEEGHEGLEKLIEDMWETLYASDGVGLAAPQIGKSIRLFLVDTEQLDEEGEEPVGIKKVFINPIIIEETGKKWEYEEGCLSIPEIRGGIYRKPNIVIEYFDENFELKEEHYDGLTARVIQHEYDHLEGILFTELLKPLKKRLIKRKLEMIKKGQIQGDYELKFYQKRRR